MQINSACSIIMYCNTQNLDIYYAYRSIFKDCYQRQGVEMLQLTRKTNESVMIGDDVEISVLNITKHQVSLGFSAPKAVSIQRKEIYLRRQEEERVGRGICLAQTGNKTTGITIN